MSKTLVPLLFAMSASLGFNTAPKIDDPAYNLTASTVEISVKEEKDDDFRHSGTGWVYSSQYNIVTAKHVVDGWDSFTDGAKGEVIQKHLPYFAIRVTFSDGQQVIVSNTKLSKKYDVAYLTLESKKLNVKHPLLKLADKRAPQGTKLYGAGFPFNYECLLLYGNVTGYHKETSVPKLIGEYLVTNATFSPGNSGGALVNEQGEVIGMADWIDQRSTALSFALPVDTIQKALNED